MRLQMLDDATRLYHGQTIVEKQRELFERPMALKFLHILRLVLFEQAILERSLVRPKGDQHFLAIGREGVSKELQAHQLPSAIAACRTFSRSLLVSGPAQPCSTLPAGS